MGTGLLGQDIFIRLSDNYLDKGKVVLFYKIKL